MEQLGQSNLNISQLSINDKFKIQYLSNLPANALNEIEY